MYKQNEAGIWVDKNGYSLNHQLEKDGVDLETIKNKDLLKGDSLLVKTKYNTIIKLEKNEGILKLTPYYSDKNEELKFIWSNGSLNPLSDSASKFISKKTNFLDINLIKKKGYDYYLEMRGDICVIGLIHQIDTSEFKTLIDFENDVLQIENIIEEDPLNKPNYLTVIRTYDEISQNKLKNKLKEAEGVVKDLKIYHTGINEFSILSVYNVNELIAENIIVNFKTQPLFNFEGMKVSEMRKQLFRELSNDTNQEEENIIKGYFKALHQKTDETAEHSERLQRLVTIIGEELMLEDDEMKMLWRMAKVHDVGKLAIEGKIINKPGKLDDTEFSIIKKHTILGYEMLKGLDSYEEAKQVCLQHHERWDGKGYPNRMKGGEIHPLVNIVTVADSVDAMASARVYKDAYSMDYVREELDRCQGTQFSPTTTKAALNVFDRLMELYE